MAVEFYHIFICASRAADEADRLAVFGLSEGAPNTHPGQGTACRRFFFHNGYVELLWVDDPAETQSEAVRPVHLWERWAGRDKGACPFGIGFRPRTSHAGSLPFPAWEYRPPYLPDSLSIQVASNAKVLTEPMLFYLSFAQRPEAYPNAKRQVLEHTPGLKEVTGIDVVSPHAANRSVALEAVSRAGLARVRTGAGYLLELGFDGEQQGRLADFRPGLPLVFRW